MPDLSFRLPGAASNWIALGALLVSLAVALGQLRGYLRKRADERREHDYYRGQIQGRAHLSVIWGYVDRLFVINDGPENAYDLRIQITTLDHEPIPDLLEPEPIRVLAVNSAPRQVKFHFAEEHSHTVPYFDDRAIDENARYKMPDAIVVYLQWRDERGTQHLRQVLTRD
jgi:hypothetical protein